PEPPAIHDHMELRMTDGRQVLYHDPRRFGLITLSSRKELVGHPLLVHLGPEPLNEEFDAAYLKKVLATRKGPVKAALMDQALVVGVGNIYASEALYISGLHPLKPANSCAGKANALVPAIRHVLQAAITSGGSSLRDFLDISGETGYFQHGFAVYGREGKPCKHCKTAIENIKITGRSSFFCPECQRL
ncbi:MAG: bifunctional DNA-formamidopyrimidine glycosylase/DNA-(apurinic or apyrimidinic site) lyase, partial [Alphaproteobacteria bacterium]